MRPDVLFDLDGTLIDSSPGILASFRRLLAERGLSPVVALDASVIGPPLGETLRHITGITDQARLAELAEGFKRDYDSQGYRLTTLFPGVPEGLARLAANGARLFIITNKRLVPTLKILDELNIARFFAGVHTRDETEPLAPSKAAVTRRVIAQYSIDAKRAFFVGDSEEDAQAARENGLTFVHAVYGYGAVGRDTQAGEIRLAHFGDLPALIGRIGRASPIEN